MEVEISPQLFQQDYKFRSFVTAHVLTWLEYDSVRCGMTIYNNNHILYCIR